MGIPGTVICDECYQEFEPNVKTLVFYHLLVYRSDCWFFGVFDSHINIKQFFLSFHFLVPFLKSDLVFRNVDCYCFWGCGTLKCKLNTFLALNCCPGWSRTTSKDMFIMCILIAYQQVIDDEHRHTYPANRCRSLWQYHQYCHLAWNTQPCWASVSKYCTYKLLLFLPSLQILDNLSKLSDMA